jgi:hypothetical protein
MFQQTTECVETGSRRFFLSLLFLSMSFCVFCYVFFLIYLQEIIMKSEPSAYKLHAQAAHKYITSLRVCVCAYACVHAP